MPVLTNVLEHLSLPYCTGRPLSVLLSGQQLRQRINAFDDVEVVAANIIDSEHPRDQEIVVRSITSERRASNNACSRTPFGDCANQLVRARYREVSCD